MSDPIKRKGARTFREMPVEILAQLQHGQIETANLVEWMALDQRRLLQNVLPELGLGEVVAPALANIARLKHQSPAQMIPVIGGALLATLKDEPKQKTLFAKLAAHRSDVVRSWASYVIGLDERRDVAAKLEAVRPFAADAHFGVREIAWWAVRSDIERELSKAVSVLATWTQERDENLRRFASEATRPRGVWCKHIEALKKNPELGYPILEPLCSDPSKYVRDSVGNWLNDASKSQPEWVQTVCEHWSQSSPTKETAYIVKRALRTVRKSN
jgi:3-methyladenine DNA glycosylase AlkC